MKQGYIEAMEKKNEGCDLCNADLPRNAEPVIKTTLGNILGKEVESDIYIFGNTLVHEISEGESEVMTQRTEIAFCPFCGRRL